MTVGLAQLATPIFDLRPPFNHAEAGTVLLVLRNGLPHTVVETGKKPRRLRGLPVMGHLQGMAITTEDIPVTLSVSGVRLRGPFPLTRADLNLRISLNRAGEYQGLMDYVTRKGVNFAQLVERELTSEIDGRVRHALGQYTADEIEQLRAGDSGIGATLRFDDAPLLEGLFAITRYDYPEVEHHPGFIEAQSAVADAAVEQTKKLLEIEQTELNAQLEQSRDAIQQIRAANRGITLPELENPDLLAANAERASAKELAEIDSKTKILSELVGQLDPIRRAGGQQAINSLFSLISEQHGGTPVGGVPQGAAPAVPTPEARPASIEASADRIIELDDLRCDVGLMDIWRGHAGGIAPVGLGYGGETVLGACLDRLGSDVSDALRAQYRTEADTDAVFIVDGIASVDDLVAEYLRLRLGELAASLAGVRLRSGVTGLTLILASDGGRLSPLTRRLNDPSAQELEPLSRILPQRIASVQTGESA